MVNSSQISTSNQQTLNNTSTSIATTPKTVKSIPYIIACRIHTIIMNKNLKKTCLKELHTILNQRGYPTTLINNRFELAEKIPQRELKYPKKHNNEKPLAYVATYNKTNQNKKRTEMIKNL